MLINVDADRNVPPCLHVGCVCVQLLDVSQSGRFTWRFADWCGLPSSYTQGIRCNEFVYILYLLQPKCFYTSQSSHVNYFLTKFNLNHIVSSQTIQFFVPVLHFHVGDSPTLTQFKYSIIIYIINSFHLYQQETLYPIRIYHQTLLSRTATTSWTR